MDKQVFGGGNVPAAGGVFGGAPDPKAEDGVFGKAVGATSAPAEQSPLTESASSQNSSSPASEKTTSALGEQSPAAGKPKGGMKRWLIGGGVALVGLAAIGAGVAFAVWKFSPNGFLHDAINNLMVADTVTVAGDVSIKTYDTNISAHLDMSTQTSGRDFRTDVTAEVTIDGDKTSVAGEAIYKDGDVFVRTDLSVFGEVPEELAEFNNNWTRFSNEKLNEVLDNEADLDADVEEFVNCVETAMNDKRARTEFLRSVIDSKVVTLSRAETRNGSVIFDVAYSTEPRNYVKAVKGVRKAALTDNLLTCAADLQSDMTKRDIFDALDETIAEMEDSLADPDDYADAVDALEEALKSMPVIQIGINQRTRQFSELTVSLKDGSTRFNLSLELDIARTKPTITAPSSYADGDELIDAIIEGIGGGAVITDPDYGDDEDLPEIELPENMSASDQRRYADLQTLMTAVARYQGNNRGMLPDFTETAFASYFSLSDPNGTRYTLKNLNTWWDDGLFISISRNPGTSDLVVASNSRSATVRQMGSMTYNIYVLYGGYCSSNSTATMFSNYSDTYWKMAVLYRGEGTTFCLDNSNR
jgi:hypothetical protein